MMSGPQFIRSPQWIIRFGGNAGVLSQTATETKTDCRVLRCTGMCVSSNRGHFRTYNMIIRIADTNRYRRDLYFKEKIMNFVINWIEHKQINGPKLAYAVRYSQATTKIIFNYIRSPSVNTSQKILGGRLLFWLTTVKWISMLDITLDSEYSNAIQTFSTSVFTINCLLHISNWQYWFWENNTYQ